MTSQVDDQIKVTIRNGIAIRARSEAPHFRCVDRACHSAAIAAAIAAISAAG